MLSWTGLEGVGKDSQQVRVHNVSELLVEEMIQVIQFGKPHTFFKVFERQVALVVKKSVCQHKRHKRQWFNPRATRSPGEGNRNPLQYS